MIMETFEQDRPRALPRDNIQSYLWRALAFLSLAAIVTACGGNTSTPPSPKLTSCAPVVKSLGSKAKCYEKTTPIVDGTARVVFHGLKKPPFLSPQTLADPNKHVSLESETNTAATFVVTGADGKLDKTASGTLEFIAVVYDGV